MIHLNAPCLHHSQFNIERLKPLLIVTGTYNHILGSILREQARVIFRGAPSLQSKIDPTSSIRPFFILWWAISPERSA